VAFEANLMRLNATTRANNSIRRGEAAKAGVAEAAWRQELGEQFPPKGCSPKNGAQMGEV